METHPRPPPARCPPGGRGDAAAPLATARRCRATTSSGVRPRAARGDEALALCGRCSARGPRVSVRGLPPGGLADGRGGRSIAASAATSMPIDTLAESSSPAPEALTCRGRSVRARARAFATAGTGARSAPRARGGAAARSAPPTRVSSERRSTSSSGTASVYDTSGWCRNIVLRDAAHRPRERATRPAPEARPPTHGSAARRRRAMRRRHADLCRARNQGDRPEIHCRVKPSSRRIHY